eukprot:GEMP01002939.1.p1 GENE.GEMP01002939.1~~GEMP01002939.1.p1  ORF type:complete len:463 (-),score=101.31 GEMP01002939.1:1274-2662(-)
MTVTLSTPVRTSCSEQSMFGTEMELLEQARQDLPNKLRFIQTKVKAILEQYFTSHALDECVQQLNDAGCEGHRDELLVLAVRFTMDSELDQAPVLLQNLALAYFKEHSSCVVRGLQKLLASISDIEIDVPHAPEFLLHLILFAVDNGLVSEEFLSRVPESLYAKVDVTEADDDLRTLLLPLLQDMRSFKQKCGLILQDFSKHRDVENAKLYLSNTGRPLFYHEFVKKALLWAIEASPNPQEEFSAVVSLLSGLFRNTLTTDDLQSGLVSVLSCLEDLSLDCPKVESLAVELICLCLLEDLFSAPFLHRCLALRIGGAMGVSVLAQVERKVPEYSRRLDVNKFKTELRKMILEYFDSHDEKEVKRIIQELSFTDDMAAEFVRKVITFAMERTFADCERALQLLEFLKLHEELTSAHIAQGFTDLYSRMDDISLDIPNALEIVQSVERQAKRAKLLDADWLFVN